MTEQELRALVRETIAKVGAAHAGGTAAAAPYVTAESAGRSFTPAATTSHSSHALFTIQGDPEGRCVIEPGVACNHCGYCKSYGH
jgi:hypothetical protein